mgnify:CR=1 FL=1
MYILPLIMQIFISTAEAGKCDAYVNQAASQSGATLVKTFAKLTRCDKKMAEENFLGAFLPRANDLNTLVSLSETAITAEVWNPTWKMLGKIKDYGTRNDVASEIGAKCSSNPQVMKFLQGAYFALKNIEFTQWDDAYLACEEETFNTWMVAQVENPPAQESDEKYNSLLTIVVKHKRVEALPHLQVAALKSAKNNGPFNSIINQMNAAVEPGLGGTMSDSEKIALEDAFMSIATDYPEKAEFIAQQLNILGSDRSSDLLKLIYADRMTGDRLSYGALAVEACESKKQAVIHLAEVTDPAKRMVILQEITEPLRSSKPKLKKCESGEWPISITPEPIKSSDDLDALVQSLTEKYEKVGFKVKVVKEATIILD